MVVVISWLTLSENTRDNRRFCHIVVCRFLTFIAILGFTTFGALELCKCWLSDRKGMQAVKNPTSSVRKYSPLRVAA